MRRVCSWKVMVWTLLLKRGSILAVITLHQQEELMNTITTIGLDLAKRVFQVHGRYLFTRILSSQAKDFLVA